jgi:hypothetical protein
VRAVAVLLLFLKGNAIKEDAPNNLVLSPGLRES